VKSSYLHFHLELKTPISDEPGSYLLLKVVPSAHGPSDGFEGFCQAAKRVKEGIAARVGVTTDAAEIVRELRAERSR